MQFYNMNEEKIEAFKQKKFYKVLNTEECHNGFQYQDGLNIDTNRFNPSGECEMGGLYFTDSENIYEYLCYGDHIREVTFPEDAIIYEESQKWKADKIILGKKYKMSIEFIKQIHQEGGDIFDFCAYMITDALTAQEQNVIFKYFIANDLYYEMPREFKLKIAAVVGDYNIVKDLVEKGVDFHHKEEYTLQLAAKHNHLEIVKYLVEQGADIHADAELAFVWAKEHDATEVAEYIIRLP